MYDNKLQQFGYSHKSYSDDNEAAYSAVTLHNELLGETKDPDEVAEVS